MSPLHCVATVNARLSAVATASQRRCKATSRSGERCRAHVINAAGYCAAHDPENPMDMRALGKLSAQARRRPNPERLNEGLRSYLRREVPPERVWQALEAAMTGENQSAKVAASRVLMDALVEEHEELERELADVRAELAEFTTVPAA